MRFLYPSLIFAIFAFSILLLTPSVYAAFEATECFDYYKFGNGLSFDSFRTVRETYSPGEDLVLTYDLRSSMESPIVDGKVKIQILHESGGYQYIVDEFFPEKDVNMFNGDVLPKESRWSVPTDAKSGDYVIKSYFVIADKFNLAGVNFVPTIPGSETRFKISNPLSYSFIHFDQADTRLNGEPYSFVGFTNSIDENSVATIKTKIVNGGVDSKTGVVVVSAYRWDDLKEENLLDSKVFSFGLNEREKQDIEFSTPQLPTDAYLVVFTAKSSDGQTLSIIKVRVSVSGAKGRFMYVGLDSFPLEANRPAKIFFCAANGADYVNVFNGSGYVDLVDSKGNVIFKDTFDNYEFPTTPPDGKITTFVPSANYFRLTLRSYMYDESGNLVDFAPVVYDYSKFENIEVAFKITTPTSITPGSNLPFTVTLKDTYGNEISSDIIVYVLDADENVVATKSYSNDGSVTDTLQLSSGLPEGTYTARALDSLHNIRTEKQFSISKFALDTQTLIIIGVVVAVVLIFIFAKLTKKI